MVKKKLTKKKIIKKKSVLVKKAKVSKNKKKSVAASNPIELVYKENENQLSLLSLFHYV